MSPKKVKFVFKEKAKVREKFPCCVLVHEISVTAAGLVWREEMDIGHPFANLAFECQDLRSKQRTASVDNSKTKYNIQFEEKCQEWLVKNIDKIKKYNDLKGVSEILEKAFAVGIKGQLNPISTKTPPIPETV